MAGSCNRVNARGEQEVVVVPWDEDRIDDFITGLGPGSGVRVIDVWGERRLVFPIGQETAAAIAKLTFC